ncbi:MAG: segregation/condensation protein A [Cyclobacteriaceae bacterium]|nr:segregation/condensation protein A [Cyclobacteriaceae bacterium]MCK5466958.1 segregation/condensation protein A [Cyclobacteriaceae bacterium]
MSFEVKIPLFEGPFDLLLFFIERDELDIYDIPISRITENFLQYLKELDKLNIEVASEFILVAAKLMRIKAKMLLPRPQLDEEGNEIDPREELVMHLLEYKKYKSVLQELASMESDMFQKEKRGNVLKEIKKLSETVNVESELQDIDLYKLLKVYQKVLKRFEIESQKPTHQVVQYPFTVEQQKDFILNKVMEKKKLSFTQIVEYNREKIGVIYNFLAILELLQLQQIMIRIGEGYNNFWIERLEKELA